MSRKIFMGLLLICFLGVPFLSAQQSATVLPEPVFREATVNEVPVFPGPASFWFPSFNEVVHFLWNFDTLDTVNMEFRAVASFAQAAQSDVFIPGSIRNNRYFLESVRLTNMAHSSFEEGDYDASRNYANEAIRFAQLSDDFVALQLKILETDNAIAAAQARLNWATSAAVNAASRYPNEFNQAQAALAEARSHRANENWDAAIAAANRVLGALAAVTPAQPGAPVPPPAPVPPVSPGVYPLPAQYTVRTWAIHRDCLWNIAGRSWAYNDPTQWRLLYNANRARMPEPDNPDLIHPGMILDIPSIRGEHREGMWVEGRNYVPLR
jgi:nucleoid-associated protein YgaU